MSHENEIEEAINHAAAVYGIMVGLEQRMAVAQTHRVHVGEYIYRLHLN